MEGMRRPVKWSVGTLVFAALAGAILLYSIYRVQSARPSSPSRVCAIAFSRDAGLLAAGSAAGRIRIWSTFDWATLAIAGESPG